VKRIEVNILGKRYPLRVNESEVESTREIARYVNERMKNFRNQLSQQSITTVMVMAAMSLAEEAMDRDPQENRPNPDEQIPRINEQLEDILDDLRDNPERNQTESE
jgi:cell division protein ZapA